MSSNWKTDKQLEKEKKLEERKIKKSAQEKKRRDQKKDLQSQSDGSVQAAPGAKRSYVGGHLVDSLRKLGGSDKPVPTKVLRKTHDNPVPTHEQGILHDNFGHDVHGFQAIQQFDSSSNDHVLPDLAQEDVSIIVKLRQLAIQKRIEQLENMDELSPELLARANVNEEERKKKKNGERQWETDRKLIERGLDEKREAFFNAFMSRNDIPPIVKCSRCDSIVENVYIECLTCREYLCGKCDFQFHYTKPFCNRDLLCHERLKRDSLSPSDYFDANSGKIDRRDVPVPLRTPSSCWKCLKTGSLEKGCGSKQKIVITYEGRFDLRSTTFTCLNPDCDLGTVDADDEQYIASRFCLPKAGNSKFIFTLEVMEFWRIYQNENPTASILKFVETLTKKSTENGRFGFISRNDFSMASRENEFTVHRIITELLKDNPTYCQACGLNPLSMHFDGNFKLYQWLRDCQYNSRSLFGTSVMESDEDRIAHEKMINAVKPPNREKASCGISTYAAGVAESRKKKNLAATGIISATCRHGVVTGFANLEKGESYRAVHFLHSKIYNRMPFKFFCQDIVCHYWKFAHEVGQLLSQSNPGFANITADVFPFLSRWHGKTHSWACQLSWSGHHKKGAAATLGEEQEQAFAYMSLLALRTKRMDGGSRRDRISGATGYRNRKKNKNMDRTLLKRMKTALRRHPELEKKLENMLKKRNLTEAEIPSKYEALKKRAIDNLDKATFSKLPLALVRQDMEGQFLQLKRLEARIKNESVSAKERAKLQEAQRKARQKGLDLMKSFNASLIKLSTERDEKKKRNEPLSPEEEEAATWLPVCEKNLYDGLFSWQTTGESFRDDCELIETFMMRTRYKEEIEQTGREMEAFLQDLKSKKTALIREIKQLRVKLINPCVDTEGSTISQMMVDRSKVVIINKEIDDLDNRIAQAVNLFDSFIKCDTEGFGLHEENTDESSSDDNDDESEEDQDSEHADDE